MKHFMVRIMGKRVKSVLVDSKLQQLCIELQDNPQRHPNYSWDCQILRRKGKAVVGNDESLRRELFESFHSSSLGGHSRAHTTKVRMSRQIYWKALAKDIRKWVRKCPVCQRCKADLVASPGLLQPLPIPLVYGKLSAWIS